MEALAHTRPCLATQDEPINVPPRIFRGLCLLLDSYNYAIDAGVPPEEFAVELPLLIEAGMSVIDLRWLQRKRQVRHLMEILPPEADGRRFQSSDWMQFTPISCFVLTTAGLEFVRRTFTPAAANPVRVVTPAVPAWDPNRRELLWGGTVVKRFRVPAPNQELILMAFQEDEWAPHIHDPLPQCHGIEPKRRLHDTIVALNRNQSAPVLRFLGDGTGLGLLWQANGHDS